jgi:hypothetical protein
MASNQPNHEQLLYAIREFKASYLELAESLSDAKEHEFFHTEIGEGIDTLNDYLSMPEIGITLREANEMVRVVKFVRENIHNEVWEIPMATIKIMAKHGITDDEMIHAAKTLTTRDFKERYYDHKTEDKGERTYSYLVMKRCNETGTLSKVYPDEIAPEILKEITNG